MTWPDVEIIIGSSVFVARWEPGLAPVTCAAFKRLLPFTQNIIHARWSGEACWVPLGNFDLDVPLESPTSRPAPGQLLFYPSGLSETEILVPYGVARFCGTPGELIGSHFLTIVEGLERLAQLGRSILWNGSLGITFKMSGL